ncbi:MAG TPA: AbrB/MazE/SpoVT family DNA-binding domain-containing protein [Clostridia bacterium]|nr:AbrB/MazE/SpoVT family DNA-binding domain-containing protein [Clostridia bacterium]
MKSIGIVRRVDMLGRIVIPKELRETLDIKLQDPMEVYVNEDEIILKKYQPACIFCENIKDDIIMYTGKRICKDCLAQLKKEVK